MIVHPSHRSEARPAMHACLAGLLLMLLLIGWPTPEAAKGIANYLPLHILLETLSIIMTALCFALVWATRKERLPTNLKLLALAALGVAVLDFSHMLSYQGMPDFVTTSNPEKAINFWLIARFCGLAGLLSAAFLSWQRQQGQNSFHYLLVLMLGLLVVPHVLFLYFPHWMPRTFHAETGLTPFKIITEYVLSAGFLLAAVGFYRHMRQPRSFSAGNFFAASVLLAQSEFFFTLYADVTDLYNISGHLYKVAGFAFLYRAIFLETVKRPYELLHKSRTQLNTTLNALPDLLFEMDLQGRYHYIYSSSAPELLVTWDYLLGKSAHQVMPPSEAVILISALQEAANQGVSRGKIIHLDTIDGQRHWFELSIARHPAHTDDEQPRFLVLSRDVTARQLAEQSLHVLSQAIEHNPLLIMVLDSEMRIRQINRAFSQLTGYQQQESLGRKPLFLLSDGHDRILTKEIIGLLLTGRPWSGELICLKKDGQPCTLQTYIYPSQSDKSTVTSYLIIADDITERLEMARMMEQLSSQDQLTGLPARSLFQEHFEQLSQSCRGIALLWLDLDNFKQVNDALGHAMGDILLQQVGYRLQDSLKDNEFVSRISGDDFAIMLPDRGQAEIIARIRQLMAALARPLALPEQSLSLTASVGVAIYPQDATDLPGLLQKAELSKYKAKAAGRNNYQFYEARMQEQAALRLAQGNALKTAIANNELFLVYQPQMCLADNRITGVEALLRWQSSEWGLVSPLDFIPLAEASGLILPISQWVLNTALHQLRNWLDEGLQPFSVAVNISTTQFERPDFVGQIQQALQHHGVAAPLLDLELTEAVAMKNPELSSQQIRELNQIGVKLSIDDFGTGYSSLSYLKRFQIDTLKIDREFVHDMDTSPDGQAIISAVIQMARRLSITTLAEGVETANQLELLRRYGCDQLQGYYFSRPLPAAELADFVRQHQASQQVEHGATDRPS